MITDTLKREGFSLIEVIVAISLLAIGLVAIVQLFSGSLRSIVFSGEYTGAIITGKAKMREFLQRNDMEEGSFTEPIDDTYSAVFDIRIVEEERNEIVPYDLYSIDLKVVWQDGLTDKSYSISTFQLQKKEVLRQGPDG